MIDYSGTSQFKESVEGNESSVIKLVGISSYRSGWSWLTLIGCCIILHLQKYLPGCGHREGSLLTSISTFLGYRTRTWTSIWKCVLERQVLLLKVYNKLINWGVLEPKFRVSGPL